MGAQKMERAMRTGSQRGFTYIGVLIAVSLIGLGLGLAGETWRLSVKREKEARLLAVGQEFRRAIGDYYNASPGSVKRYPPSLEALLKDDRYPGTRRHLRRIYPDPMIGKAEWGLVASPGNGIAGVYSLSVKTPVKQGNFSDEDSGFEGRASYRDWRFVYRPPQTGHETDQILKAR